MSMGRFTKQVGARSVRKALMAMPLAVFAVGCGGELPEQGQTEGDVPVAPSEAVEQTEQGVVLGGSYWWGISSGVSQLNMGTSVGRTCFLTGVQGNLKPGSSANTNSVYAYIYAGNWYLAISQNNNMALGAGVQCINTDTNRTLDGVWFKGDPARLLGAVTAQRRCFLTRVEGSGGFTTNADYARVWNDGLNWYLGGSLTGEGGARARCVDVPTDQGSWGYGAGDPGGFTANMTYNPGGVACMLTGLGGHFTANSFTDGVSIDYNAGTRYWEMTVVNGKRGWSSCVK
ncbi:hypothetical protein [Pyxidicoccus trucidator]|uniref:hypothetical protein n=1 Tax=Pyxidicoccus trucidator TaxID=2709662 RepID=UPI001F07966A|nr:hypothetical protein [Pyxidicoccus trucidator]